MNAGMPKVDLDTISKLSCDEMYTNAEDKLFNQSSDYVLIQHNKKTNQCFIDKAFEFLDLYPGIGIVVLNQFNVDVQDLRICSDGVAPFDSLESLEAISGSSFVVRKQCVEQIGGLHHEFLDGLFDIEYWLRCRKNGWRVLLMNESSHQSPGICLKIPSLSNGVRSKLRNLYLAMHAPNYFYNLYNYQNIEEDKSVPQREWVKYFSALIQNNPNRVAKKVLTNKVNQAKKRVGELRTDHMLGSLELALRYRSKPTLAIYDHALQFAGGGQKYACTMASCLQDQFEITFISNKEVNIQQLENWYGLDLSKCEIKIIKIPFFEKKNREQIDQGAIPRFGKNPFELISEESSKYDIFLNVNMLTKFTPRSNVSVFLCHFPDSSIDRYFGVDKYTHIIVNSQYTIDWLGKKWNLRPDDHVYPPVDMKSPPCIKEKIILSVARFDATGSKNQHLLIDAFNDLCRSNKEVKSNWKLILAGGTFGNNLYFRKIQKQAESNANISICENLNVEELKNLYASASIFWHACGLNTDIPERIEHFGMTTVEAMQNGCVPIVINKGGQCEIVKNGHSGYLFNDLKELQQYTSQLIADKKSMSDMSLNSIKASAYYDRPRFERQIRLIFDEINQRYFKVDSGQLNFVDSIKYQYLNERDIEIPSLIQFADKNKKHIQSLLDIGACYSHYYYAKELRDTIPHARYDGIDVQPDETTKSILDNYYTADATDYDLPLYDAVTCVSTIEHSGIYVNAREDYWEEQLRVFKIINKLATKFIYLTFPYGKKSVIEDQYANITKTLLDEFIEISQGKVHKKFYFNEFAMGKQKWRVISESDAGEAPAYKEKGVQCVCILEIDKRK